MYLLPLNFLFISVIDKKSALWLCKILTKSVFFCASPCWHYKFIPMHFLLSLTAEFKTMVFVLHPRFIRAYISVCAKDITSVLWNKSSGRTATLKPPDLSQVPFRDSSPRLFRPVHPLGKGSSSTLRTVDRDSPVILCRGAITG